MNRSADCTTSAAACELPSATAMRRRWFSKNDIGLRIRLLVLPSPLVIASPKSASEHKLAAAARAPSASTKRTAREATSFSSRHSSFHRGKAPSMAAASGIHVLGVCAGFSQASATRALARTSTCSNEGAGVDEAASRVRWRNRSAAALKL